MMMKSPLLLLLPLLPHHSTPFSPGDSTQLTQGQSQYQQLAQLATLPRYGPCWVSALSHLQSTCSHLSDTTQARLALQFANCFLAQAGQQVYPCQEGEEIARCLQGVDNNAFTAYSNFYTHTQNMCYFLKSQEWQEITDNTITRLSSSSAKVAREMEESQHLQKEIAIGQQSSLEYQRQLAENGSFLSQAIETSKDNVKVMLDEFRMSTNEQKTMIFEVFDRVSKLQNLVVSEVSWLYTVVFYSACLLVIYLVTATKRTADSRLWMFFILTANFGLERLVIWGSLPGAGENAATDLSQIVSGRIWLVRNMAIFVSIVVLTFMAVRFRDLNVVNNSLLEEIKRQNLELKKSMENFQVGNKMRSSSQNIPINSVDTLDGHFSSLSNMLAEDAGFIGDEEDYSDTDSDSFNSTRTDRTFDPDSLEQNLSGEQFSTAATSRETTPTSTNQVMDTIDMAMEALTSSLVHSTPAKRIPTIANKQPSGPTPPSSSASPYNLRSRNSLGGSTMNSPLVETPDTFARLVKEQLGRSKRNYSKWKMAVGKQKEDYSDDE
eukprot:GFUD01134475.1.p1 GENE.GFUD01134475.1~~GFUD01134475.1.p1  ORF type:complete len:549 (+),score=210.84 GFUD01134475.1:102-1748(+)